MSTQAILVLKKANVSFDVISYQHDQKGAVFAAQATGFPLEQTVKTLITNLGDRRYAAALVPGDKKLDLKLLARAFKVKAAGMADGPTAQRLSGYKIGGISPFGMRQHLETIMERSVLKCSSIAINAGKRGLMVKMAPHDIVEVLACKVAAIVK